MAQHDSGRGGERAAGPAAKPPVAVERITHQDVPEICSLYKRVWDAPPITGIPAELLKSWQPTALEFTSGMEGVTYFAARRDGRLIGAIGCEMLHGSCEIIHLAVDAEARRSGVAAALVTAAIDWARRSGANQVWSHALARLTGVGALFRSLGFAECGVLHKHDWGEDVRLFERTL